MLTNEGRFEGPTPALTATQSLDLQGLTRIAAQRLGRTLERRVIEDETLQARMTQRGLPPQIVDIALGMYRASRNGEFSAADPTLAQMLGRAPKTIESLIAAKFEQ
ncbi:MAG: hypothetical protein ACREP7_22175 [Lysobacter sp.]